MGKLHFTYTEWMSMPFGEIEKWVKIVEYQLKDEEAKVDAIIASRKH